MAQHNWRDLLRKCANVPSVVWHATRTNAVPGDGSAKAEILFIGEGPGYHEDQQGLPFVGRSGDYLSYLLEQIRLKREDVFITNIIKCRAPNNRDPLPNEIQACRPYFERQLALIDPLVVATLGRFSMRLFFPGASISRIHGQARIEGGRAYLPLYHPAAALRNPNLRHDMEADIAQLLALRDEMRPPPRHRRGARGATRTKDTFLTRIILRRCRPRPPLHPSSSGSSIPAALRFVRGEFAAGRQWRPTCGLLGKRSISTTQLLSLSTL